MREGGSEEGIGVTFHMDLYRETETGREVLARFTLRIGLLGAFRR